MFICLVERELVGEIGLFFLVWLFFSLWFIFFIFCYLCNGGNNVFRFILSEICMRLVIEGSRIFLFLVIKGFSNFGEVINGFFLI